MMITPISLLTRSIYAITPKCLPKVAIRHSSAYRTSPFLIDLQPNVSYEVTQSPEDWKYVERTLPPLLVPDPIKKNNYPSGWKPQGDNFRSAPYYISRSKSHMIPVYLLIGQWGIRRVTVVKKIQGDIWLLEKEIREFLQPQTLKPLRTQVNEFIGQIRIYGDHVNAIKHLLMQKNL